MSISYAVQLLHRKFSKEVNNEKFAHSVETASLSKCLQSSCSILSFLKLESKLAEISCTFTLLDYFSVLCSCYKTRGNCSRFSWNFIWYRACSKLLLAIPTTENGKAFKPRYCIRDDCYCRVIHLELPRFSLISTSLPSTIHKHTLITNCFFFTRHFYSSHFIIMDNSHYWLFLFGA